MPKSEPAKGQESTGFRAHMRQPGTFVLRAHGHIVRHFCRFGRAVVGLWPNKPGAHLAEVAGISERNANQLISGDRKVTARAIVAIDHEMLD